MRRRANKWKPKMIGPPAALAYDSADCPYPGLIRVCFDDGHTVVYSARDMVAPIITQREETTVIVEYEAPKRRRRAPGIPSRRRLRPDDDDE